MSMSKSRRLRPDQINRLRVSLDWAVARGLIVQLQPRDNEDYAYRGKGGLIPVNWNVIIYHPSHRRGSRLAAVVCENFDVLRKIWNRDQRALTLPQKAKEQEMSQLLQVIVKRPYYKAEVLWLTDATLSEGVYVQTREDSLSAEFIPYVEGVKVYEYHKGLAQALKRATMTETETAILERLRLLYPPLPPVPELPDVVDEVGDHGVVLCDGTELSFECLGRTLAELARTDVARNLAFRYPTPHGTVDTQEVVERLTKASQLFLMLADRG